MEKLGYDRWENFSRVIQKAAIACASAGEQAENHFRGVTKMVKIGSGAQHQLNSYIKRKDKKCH